MAEKKTIKFLSKADIFQQGAKSLADKHVLVEEWGGNVRYKPMTMATRRDIRKRCQVKELDSSSGEETMTLDAEAFEVLALIYCCLDPEDPTKLLFRIEDRVNLVEKVAAGPISVISKAILVDSGLAPDAIKRGHSGTEN